MCTGKLASDCHANVLQTNRHFPATPAREISISNPASLSVARQDFPSSPQLTCRSSDRNRPGIAVWEAMHSWQGCVGSKGAGGVLGQGDVVIQLHSKEDTCMRDCLNALACMHTIPCPSKVHKHGRPNPKDGGVRAQHSNGGFCVQCFLKNFLPLIDVQIWSQCGCWGPSKLRGSASFTVGLSQNTLCCIHESPSKSAALSSSACEVAEPACEDSANRAKPKEPLTRKQSIQALQAESSCHRVKASLSNIHDSFPGTRQSPILSFGRGWL